MNNFCESLVYWASLSNFEVRKKWVCRVIGSERWDKAFGDYLWRQYIRADKILIGFNFLNRRKYEYGTNEKGF